MNESPVPLAVFEECNDSRRCFVIAEAGVNHNGDPDVARRLVDVAVDAGADAVKFQTFKAEKLVTPTADKAQYQKKTSGADETQFDMLARLELGRGDHEALRDYCAERDILFLSTPFDRDSASFLDELGVPLFKVGSGDLTNIPLLEHIAGLDKPMIVSTGMSWLGEVERAVRAVEEVGNKKLALLHCVSQYPAPAEHSNLRAVDTLREAFGYPVGFSDHTMGIEVPIAAVARGARVVEKHFTLDRAMEGPDHAASLEPEELEAMISGIRKVESALGDGRKRPRGEEADVAAVARKSIVAARDIAAGTTIKHSDLALRRPGTGLKPQFLDSVVGRTAVEDIDQNALISWTDLQ